MRFFVTILSGVGAYFIFGYIVSQFFKAGIDVPMVEMSQNLVLSILVVVSCLLTWATVK